MVECPKQKEAIIKTLGRQAHGKRNCKQPFDQIWENGDLNRDVSGLGLGVVFELMDNFLDSGGGLDQSLGPGLYKIKFYLAGSAPFLFADGLLLVDFVLGLLLSTIQPPLRRQQVSSNMQIIQILVPQLLLPFPGVVHFLFIDALAEVLVYVLILRNNPSIDGVVLRVILHWGYLNIMQGLQFKSHL